MYAKSIFCIALIDTKQEFREHEKMVFHIALEFPDCDEPFVWKLSESGRDAENRAQPGMVTRSTLRESVGERDPYCSNSARSGYMRRHRKTERCTTSQLS